MKRALSSPNPIAARCGVVAVAVSAALMLAACGGGDDSAGAATTTLAAAAPTTTIPFFSATTLPAVPVVTTPVVTTPVFTTSGAKLIVANSSTVNGAAGRLTDRLAIAGFSTGPATNGSEGQLAVTKIYYDPTNESAKAVAESVRIALGGGDIQLYEMGVPAPIESGDAGDADIVVSMGNDVVDKSLEELQGRVPAASDGTATATSAPSGG